jgi:hypothetical protein
MPSLEIERIDIASIGSVEVLALGVVAVMFKD